MMENSGIESLIEDVQNTQKFQNRFIYIFNVILVIAATFLLINYVFALSIPDHWCFIPGIEETNLTLEEWKSIHIPKDNTTGIERYSKCKMFSYNKNGTRQITDCRFGHSFDKTWYESTIVSQENWVCDKAMYVTNSLVASKLGETVGLLIFGYIADNYGRKPVFFICLVVSILGRIMSILTTNWVNVFIFITFIGNFPSSLVIQTPIVISIEISKKENRNKILFLSAIAFGVAMCTFPFIAWKFNNWKHFMYISTIPIAFFLFTSRLMIESPRWLANKGKAKKCFFILRKIAAVNKCSIPENAIERLEKLSHENPQTNILNLFSSWRLVKNSFILILTWGIVHTIFYFLLLNSSNLVGNPFLNFFWQFFIEFPSYVVGKFLLDKLGRRFTNSLSFIIISLSGFAFCIVISNNPNSILIIILTIIIKSSVTVSIYCFNLQGMEIYPTCIRQSGLSITGVSRTLMSATSPYLIYLGNEVNVIIPYIIFSIASLACSGIVLFLPETRNCKLPETLQDAAIFGKNQNWKGEEKKESTEDVEIALNKLS